MIRTEKILKVVEKNIYFYADNIFGDYKLEDGTILMEIDYDEEKRIYIVDFDVYEPITKYEFENIDISKINPDSQEWKEAHEIVAFNTYNTI